MQELQRHGTLEKEVNQHLEKTLNSLPAVLVRLNTRLKERYREYCMWMYDTIPEFSLKKSSKIIALTALLATVSLASIQDKKTSIKATVSYTNDLNGQSI